MTITTPRTDTDRLMSLAVRLFECDKGKPDDVQTDEYVNVVDGLFAIAVSLNRIADVLENRGGGGS